MNKITEIVYGNSTFLTLSNTNFRKNRIINFNTFFSIGDLSFIEEFKINVPQEIFTETKYDFTEQMIMLNLSIKEKNKIRIWCSRHNSDEYILLLFISDYLKNKDCNISVVYVDDYNSKYQSVSMLRENELEKAVGYEKKLLCKDIEQLSKLWKYVKDNNANMRIMINNSVKLVSYDYFDDIILHKLKELGRVKEWILVGKLMSEYHLVDLIFVYLIDRLIKNDKIRIVVEDINREFDNIIEINI